MFFIDFIFQTWVSNPLYDFSKTIYLLKFKKDKKVDQVFFSLTTLNFLTLL